MADIDIQRKGPSIWPWILGLLALGLLIWAMVEMFDDDATEDPVATTFETEPVTPAPGVSAAAPAESGPTATPAPVQQYMTTCAPREPAAMGLDHQYTSNCIQQLMDGIDAILQSPNLAGVDVQAQMQAARQSAQQLAQSAERSTDHARMTQEAFRSIATLLNGIQDARYPDLDGQVTQLEETAQGIQPGGNLLDQRESVQRFFAQAGELLNGMARTPTAGA